MFPHHEQVVLDLGGVTRCNMAGLALLIQWLHLLHKEQVQVRLTCVPKALAALAEICEVMPILAPYLGADVQCSNGEQ